MTTPTTAELLKYADLQMAAEAFLVNSQGTPLTGDLYLQALIDGNNHASKFTVTQAKDFADHWIVLDQKANTPTGFSGTLFKNRETGELVISLRSTEFVDDAARDNQATNSMEIKEKGWAFGQIDDMEKWYAEIKGNYAVDFAAQEGKFALTGYSLGRHQTQPTQCGPLQGRPKRKANPTSSPGVRRHPAIGHSFRRRCGHQCPATHGGGTRQPHRDRRSLHCQPGHRVCEPRSDSRGEAGDL
jgi:hypothetical protein